MTRGCKIYIGYFVSAKVLQFVSVTDAPNRIRELRMAAKLSQQRVADAIGMSKMTISDLERGTINLSLAYMERIARCSAWTSPTCSPTA